MIHPENIPISDFTYDLPQEKIAVYPLEKRDDSKLLVFKNSQITDDVFTGIDNYLDKDCVLVFNNTRVIRARLNFLSEGKPIEIFCLEPAGGSEGEGIVQWNCLVGKLKSWKSEKISLTKNDITLHAAILEKKPTHVTVNFKWTPPYYTFSEVLGMLGAMPIPPYLNRQSEELDVARYQTIYAQEEGSVAAPTAGLHFTPGIIRKLEEKGVKKLEVTLHVGAGTFKPVKSVTMQDHEMHAEWISVSIVTIKELLKNLGKKIIPVGTTSLRTIESLYWMGVKISCDPGIHYRDLEVGQWEPYSLMEKKINPGDALNALIEWMESKSMAQLICRTGILIAPPYELKLASGLITNFHQPQSTLLLLVSAVVGDKWKEIYEHALTHDYRFLSYGDSSLLLK